jgi:thiamine pyrophosphate-dependent acetolactate synthase large subunit-like protein
MNVCDALIDILAEYGVRYIFGIPGDSINQLTESIRKQNKIKFIHVMHEESGAFAAAAIAKLSGELSACCGTSGPGAIHLLNGLYDAKMDHAPVIAITGQVDTSELGTNSQQEINTELLFQDVSVYNQTIIDPAQMPEMAILACQTALARRGVAHISIPVNISSQPVKHYREKKQIVLTSPRIIPQLEDLQRAAKKINEAKDICILAGIGSKHAVPELLKLAEIIKAPIVKALRGKDIIPDDHPSILGGLGLLGTEPSMNAVRSCRLLLIIGSDFPYAEFYPDQTVTTIQIDIKTEQIGLRHPVDVPLIGDAHLTLVELLPLIDAKTNNDFLNKCRKEKEEWDKKMNKEEQQTDTPIHPQVLASAVSDQAWPNAIICCDTGTVTFWTARHFKIKEGQRFTVAGKLATMAVALPAALGAKLIYPEKQVIAFCGDGGFAMLMCDFATAVKYNLPIKVFVFNNSKLGLIQMEQEASAGIPEYETDLHNPDYAMFALACGGEGITVKEFSDLEPAVSKALSSNKATVVNVIVNPGELTMPPEITAEKAFNYVKAKITEFLIK